MRAHYNEVFQVVEHQQDVGFAKLSHQAREWVPRAGFDAGRSGHGGQSKTRIRDRCERNDDNTVHEVVGEVIRDRMRQAGLPYTSGAGNCDKACAVRLK